MDVGLASASTYPNYRSLLPTICLLLPGQISVLTTSNDFSVVYVRHLVFSSDIRNLTSTSSSEDDTENVKVMHNHLIFLFCDCSTGTLVIKV